MGLSLTSRSFVFMTSIVSLNTPPAPAHFTWPTTSPVGSNDASQHRSGSTGIYEHVYVFASIGAFASEFSFESHQIKRNETGFGWHWFDLPVVSNRDGTIGL